MKEIKFAKMHGLGNDYIYINLDEYPIQDLPAFARKYSHRRFGIGGDGIITYGKGGEDSYRMRIFNIDGSEATMCGNAIRCVAKLLYEKNLCRSEEIRINTLSGEKILQLTIKDRVMTLARVDMNPPKVLNNDHTLIVNGENISGLTVDVGNPHFVHFIDQDPDDYPLDFIGPMVETHPAFDSGVNYEIIQVFSEHHVKMRVWERGSGLTFACGTGATAVVVAGISKGILKSPVQVDMPGGALSIEWNGDESSPAFMIGGATLVYEGTLVDEDNWLGEN